MVMLGGEGTVFGPVLGALVFVILEESVWAHFLEANQDFSVHYFNALKLENGILTNQGCFGNENLERNILDSLKNKL